MRVAGFESLPLPDDPTLAVWASALNEAGYWAYVFDSSWRYVFVTDDLRIALGDTGPVTSVPLGSHVMSAEARRWNAARIGGEHATRRELTQVSGYVLATTPGGRDELRRVADPEVADLVDELHDSVPPPVWTERTDFSFAGKDAASWNTGIFVLNTQGAFVGVCSLAKPAAPMTQFAVAVGMADPGHLERLRVVEVANRHPAAILMADLEASTPLARRLSASQYFAFVRRLVRATDEHIVAEGGIVGRHAGDGMVGFFLPETAGSESRAAKSCILAGKRLRESLADIAARSEIPASEISLRFGLHWGATLYMGRILTAGRSEVNAFGDEMNEAARIEACASGGRTLASKALIERLDREDAVALEIDPARTSYTQLGELDGATEKARRDAPSIPVCDITRANL